MADDKQTPVADTKPDWLKKTEELQELVKEGKGVQVAWRSDTGDPCCVPIMLTEKMQSSSMPISIEEPPTDMLSPKRQWFGENLGWYDNNVNAQGMRLTAVEQQIAETQKNVSADLTNVTKTINRLKQDSTQHEADSKATDKKLAQAIQLMTVNNVNMGKLTAMVQTLFKKGEQPVKSESASESTQSSEPAQPSQPQGGNK